MKLNTRKTKDLETRADWEMWEEIKEGWRGVGVMERPNRGEGEEKERERKEGRKARRKVERKCSVRERMEFKGVCLCRERIKYDRRQV